MKRLNWYGFIGEGEPINALMVQEALKDAAGEDLQIYLHSKGGDVFEARNIYQQLKEYSGSIEIILGGVVASAGTYISLAASPEKLIANDDTAYMIHNAWTIVIGDFREMAKAATDLRKQNKMIADRMAERSGKDADEIIEMMNEETWLYGQEIVDAGFADRLNQTNNAQNGMRDDIIKKAKIEVAASMHKIAARTRTVAFPKDAPQKPKKPEEGEIMTRKEAIEFISNEMNATEIANAFGIKIVTKESRDLLARLQEQGIEDPIADIASLKSKLSENEDAVRQAKISIAFGEKGTDEEPNPERNYADKVLANVSLDKMDEEIQNLATDSTMKAIAKQRADENSTLNEIDSTEKESSKIIEC